MKQEYLSLILLIERLHRRFLDVIKSELDRLNIEEVNNVQTLILYNIGDETLTVGELTERGYYLGSNVSYNIKKLVESDYLLQERSPHDKRSVKIRLSPKGRELCDKIDRFYQKNIQDLSTRGFDSNEITKTFGSLRTLEDYWSLCVNSVNKI